MHKPLHKPHLRVVIDNAKAPVAPYQPKQRAACLVIYRALDPETAPSDWEPVKPDDVAPFLKRDLTVLKLVEGFMAQNEDKDEAGVPIDPYWYRAEELTIEAQA